MVAVAADCVVVVVAAAAAVAADGAAVALAVGGSGPATRERSPCHLQMQRGTRRSPLGHRPPAVAAAGTPRAAMAGSVAEALTKKTARGCRREARHGWCGCHYYHDDDDADGCRRGTGQRSAGAGGNGTTRAAAAHRPTA